MILDRPIIELKDVSINIDGVQILENISFQINKGETVGVIGPNGAGKTTLLKAILGLVKIDRGKIQVFGTKPALLGEKRRLIGYIPQMHAFEPRFPVSSTDVVSMGLLNHHPRSLFSSPRRQRQVLHALESVGLADYAHHPFHDLSGGQQQSILLARAIVAKPQLLLLDEPNSSLDVAARESFLRLLENLQKQLNLTIMMVSHDLRSIASFTHSLICINGSMHIHGNAAEVIRSPHLRDLYRCQYDLLDLQNKLMNDHSEGTGGVRPHMRRGDELE